MSYHELSDDDARYVLGLCDELSARFDGVAVVFVFNDRSQSFAGTRMSTGELMRTLCTWVGSRLFEFADKMQRRASGRPDYDA